MARKGNVTVAALVTVGAIAAVTAFFALHMHRFSLDATTKSLVLQSDPDLAYYNATREYFGSDEYVVVAFSTPDIFTPENIRFIDRLTRCGPAHSRRYLRRVVFRQRTQTIGVPPTASSPPRLLRLQPLEVAAPIADPVWSFEPFRLQGIQVQLLAADPASPREVGDSGPPRNVSQTIPTSFGELSTLAGTRT